MTPPARLRRDQPSTIAAERSATRVPDPGTPPPIRCADPDDDDLIAVAHASGSALVTGDAALLALAERIPVFAPRDFLTLLQ